MSPLRWIRRALLRRVHRKVCRASHWSIDTIEHTATCNVCGYTEDIRQ